MKCTKCKRPVFNKEYMLCRDHWYSRNSNYTYLGHRRLILDDIKIRKCLKCDKEFESTGIENATTAMSLVGMSLMMA